jgi:hypothetical protein
VPSGAEFETPGWTYVRESNGVAAISMRSPATIPARAADDPGSTLITVYIASTSMPNSAVGCHGRMISGIAMSKAMAVRTVTSATRQSERAAVRESVAVSVSTRASSLS